MITSSKISKRKKRSQRLAFGLFRLTSLAWSWPYWYGFWVSSSSKAAGVVSWEFLTCMPENGMTEGGILPAIVGTLCLVAGSIAVAFPLGVMSGIYVSEYARDNWLVRVIRVMTSNLSGVPSIVFGLFGMALFVRTLGFGDSIIAGSLTLALLVLPIVIRTTEEAMRSIDNSLRNGRRARRDQTADRLARTAADGFPEHRHRADPLDRPRVGRDGAHPVHGRRLFPAETARQYFRSGHGPALSPVRDRNERNGSEASRPMAYGTALVLIAIVLLINLLANGLRRYFGRKVKTN